MTANPDLPDNPRKTFRVGCAIVLRNSTILIAQRPEGSHLAGFWEFPGGKCEEGESLEDCLRREVMEELGIEICPGRTLTSMVHEYPERILDLHFVFCDWVSGEPKTIECADFRWVVPGELKNYEFPKADESVLRFLMENTGDYLR